uniref:Csu type fimbrial protein n=1 Tax=uncultured Halomonas sp. TaxID=173971 RepID=UPI0026215B4E|nr:spore coat U domain-containing protein [uncultured Halomonas sp.]
MMKRKALAAALIVSAGLWPASALAVVTCTVSSSNVAFGVYEPLTGSNLDSAGSIVIECERAAFDGNYTVPFEVTLSPSGNGSFVPRVMSSGAGILEYNIYTAASRNVVWGDGAGGTASRNGSISLPFLNFGPEETTITTYGRIPGGQFVPAGSYSDIITVTVAY